jgi:hypothetical protein
MVHKVHRVLVDLELRELQVLMVHKELPELAHKEPQVLKA